MKRSLIIIVVIIILSMAVGSGINELFSRKLLKTYGYGTVNSYLPVRIGRKMKIEELKKVNPFCEWEKRYPFTSMEQFHGAYKAIYCNSIDGHIAEKLSHTEFGLYSDDRLGWESYYNANMGSGELIKMLKKVKSAYGEPIRGRDMPPQDDYSRESVALKFHKGQLGMYLFMVKAAKSGKWDKTYRVGMDIYHISLEDKFDYLPDVTYEAQSWFHGIAIRYP